MEECMNEILTDLHFSPPGSVLTIYSRCKTCFIEKHDRAYNFKMCIPSRIQDPFHDVWCSYHLLDKEMNVIMKHLKGDDIIKITFSTPEVSAKETIIIF